ncbi:MAG: hypothetical protein AAGA48_08400 [Myxococcota bacterium]
MYLFILLACTSRAPKADAPTPPPPKTSFEALRPGLEMATFIGDPPSPVGDSRIVVVRIDPSVLDIVLLAASSLGTSAKAPKAWVEQHGLLAATNAALYEPDYLTATFHMRQGDHINQAKLNPDANHFLLLDPIDGTLPAVQIVDRTCETVPFEAYRTVVQGYRITDCEGNPAFKDRERIWSHASIGIDKSGRMLWLFSRSPWSTHDFAEVLTRLPLDLHRVQYAEGGPPAALVLQKGKEQWLGSYESGAFQNNENQTPFELPFVLGVRPR